MQVDNFHYIITLWKKRVISLNRSTFHLKFPMCITRTVYKCWDYRVTTVSVARRIFWTGQLQPSSQDMAQDKNHGQNFTTDLKH